ncbi:MAG TPA: insulinase family protein [Candidatus Kapabacteria bacterium]|nr:insulinase family protein [Candidatus Kapabacteria bacterium]HPO63675.1 insulinase family protein [Candidatus Kapabacteria bacterium]
MKKLLIPLLIIVFFGNVLFSQTKDCKSNQIIPTDKTIRIGYLDNGLKYYIKKNVKPEKRAHLRLVVKTGAIQEDDDQNGLAHFCEHMAFNGTKNYPKNELLDFLQKSGMEFGADINASTGLEVTQYELPIPCEDEKFLEKCFEILEDWAHNVTYDNAQIDGERGVLVSEWRQRNSPNFRVRTKLAEYIYKDSKYAKRNIIGDTGILKHFDYDVIKRFYRDWYRPDLMAVIAVGDFDVDKVESLIKKYFNRIPKAKNPREHKIFDIPNNKELIVGSETDKELSTEQASILIKLNEYNKLTYGGYYETLKRNLYDAMFASRINEILQKPNPPFVNAFAGEGSYQSDRRVYSMNIIAKQGQIKSGLDAMLTEAIRVLKYGFTQSELDRAKSDMFATYQKYFNERNTTVHSSYVSEFTNAFTSDVSIPGIENEFEYVKSCVPNISLNEVNDLAKLYLKKENWVITYSAPEANAAGLPSNKEIKELWAASFDKNVEPYKDVASEKSLFSKKVKDGSIVDEKFDKELNTHFLTLSNGAKVILKPTNFKEKDIVFEAFSQGGLSLCDDKDYVSGILSTTFIGNAGLGEFDLPTLQKKLSGKIIRVFPYIDDLYEGLKGNCSTADFETLMQMVNLYFSEPRNDKDAYETLLSRIKSAVANRGNSSDEVFKDSVAVISNNRHFRRRPITSDVLNEVNLDNAFNIYKNRFANSGDFTFVFVGDFNLEEAKMFVKKYIASLPSEKNNEKWEDRKIGTPHKSITNTFKKGNEERAHVRLIIPGELQWSEENQCKMNSISNIIQIKMIETVREEKAGIYSPGVWVELNKYPLPDFSINIDFVCEPKRVDELIDATLKIVKDLQNKVDETDLEKVVSADIKNYEVYMKNNNFWVSNLVNYMKNDDNLKDIVKYEDYLKQLNTKSVQDCAKNMINLNRIIRVVNLPETY